MRIMTCATNYSVDQVLPFMITLEDMGFDGDIYCICNGSPAEDYLRSKGVKVIPDQDNGFDINSRRFFIWKEYLRGYDGITLITDIRDVIFQLPLSELPNEGVHVFTEDSSKTIGTCPYNSGWMKYIKDPNPYANKPIICAGVTVGQLGEYCTAMWEAIRDLPPIRGLDQAVHNYLIYSGRVAATIHSNPVPVYTVGYIPYNTVEQKNGHIVQGDLLPTIVHQYDRHPDLKEMF